MKKKLFIFGSGTISEIAYYYFANESEYQICGFVEYRKFIKKKTFHKLPVIEFEKVEKFFPSKNYYGFVAIGYRSLNDDRTKVYKLLKKKKYKLASFVSKNSHIAKNVKIGDNCFILEKQIIQPFTNIGNNVTLWCGNIIGHHCTIKDNCFITSNVVIAGYSSVGENTFIGIKSAIRDKTKIGKYCAVLMNSSIGKNMPDKATSLSQLSNIYDIKNHNIKVIRKKYFY